MAVMSMTNGVCYWLGDSQLSEITVLTYSHLWEYKTYLNLGKRYKKKQGRDKVIQERKNMQPLPNTHLLQGQISYSPVLRTLPLSYLSKVFSKQASLIAFIWNFYVNNIEVRSEKPKKDIKSLDIYTAEPCMCFFQERNNEKNWTWKRNNSRQECGTWKAFCLRSLMS